MLAEAEKYVDAVAASEFLGVTTRFLLDLTRAGRIPGHPLGLGAKRHVWRFRLSELDHAIGALTPPAPMAKNLNCSSSDRRRDSTSRSEV